MTQSYTTSDIQDHYDRLALFYRTLWGEHIHHGYWEDDEPKDVAQVKLIEKLADLAEIPGSARVLDVGCGFGGSSLWLAQNLDCEVTGITISPIQLSLARRRAQKLGLHRRVSFQRMDANHLAFPEASFDVVWVIECSEHLEDKAAFIRACHRLLRPGGRLAICAWLKANDLSTRDEIQYIERVCHDFLCPSLGTMDDYLGWMSACGFQVIASLDVTRRVERTWEMCTNLTRRRDIQMLLKFADERIRGFVNAFETIQAAFAQKKMIYGMMVGRKKTVISDE